MILNPFCCPNCKRELQPEDLGMKTDDEGNLVRVCMFCNDEVVIK